MSLASARFQDGRWVVAYEGQELARFKPQDDSNAIDFCNGFNKGLDYGAAPYRVSDEYARDYMDAQDEMTLTSPPSQTS
jgi:hypothetical protein